MSLTKKLKISYQRRQSYWHEGEYYNDADVQVPPEKDENVSHVISDEQEGSRADWQALTILRISNE